MKLWIFLTFVIFVTFGTCRKYNRSQNLTLTLHDALTNSFKYYTKANEGITIPIMFHVDKALTTTLFNKRRSRKEIERFKAAVKNLLKDVEAIFRKPSLRQKVNLVFLNVQVLKNKLVELNENISTYLKSYCQWQGRMKKSKGHWYFSVLLTGLDFYSVRNGRKVRLSAGRSYVGSVCSTHSSCALVEWHPKHTANLLAHEIAHSLGVSHDGPPDNQCKGRHIMEASYYESRPAQSWSQCSKRELQQFIKSKGARCLQSQANWQ